MQLNPPKPGEPLGSQTEVRKKKERKRGRENEENLQIQAISVPGFQEWPFITTGEEMLAGLCDCLLPLIPSVTVVAMETGVSQ